MKKMTDTARKIVSEREAARIARTMRMSGKVLVAVGGSFDILHAGHIALLEHARAKGDALIVLLNSDASVRKYKGPHRPVVPQRERSLMLASLACVDRVVLFDDLNQKRILDVIRPPVVCKADDWGKDCIERATVEAYRGRIALLPIVKGYSTTNIIRALLRAEHEPDVGAVFLDRDGVINNDTGYVHDKNEFSFLPGAIAALRALTKSKYKIIVVTNQSGIGREYFPRAHVERLHRWMRAQLRAKGVRIDAVYLCPHSPDAGCDCRKPAAGLLLRAAGEHGLSLAKSWLVGDSERDIVAAREANVQSVKIGARMGRTLKLEPTAYAKDLRDAVRIILRS